jgi:nucleotide-binding universal stress UspA family protein
MSIKPVKRILVPIDLSQTSLNALDTAVSLATKFDASIHLINVIERIPAQAEMHMEPTQTNLDVLTALKGAIIHTSGHSPTLIQDSGNVVECIVNTAISKQIDLVVMGTHGASGYREGFIGSTAYGAIKYSTCSILTVPFTRKYLSFNKVLFPIRPVKGALAPHGFICQFLSTFGTLEVLGLSQSMQMGTGLLDKIAEEIKSDLKIRKVRTVTAWGKTSIVADEILQSSMQGGAELIILTSLLDAINKHNFIGPHTQKIINCAKMPVLIVKKVGVPMLA